MVKLYPPFILFIVIFLSRISYIRFGMARRTPDFEVGIRVLSPNGEKMLNCLQNSMTGEQGAKAFWGQDVFDILTTYQPLYFHLLCYE